MLKSVLTLSDVGGISRLLIPGWSRLQNLNPTYPAFVSALNPAHREKAELDTPPTGKVTAALVNQHMDQLRMHRPSRAGLRVGCEHIQPFTFSTCGNGVHIVTDRLRFDSQQFRGGLDSTPCRDESITVPWMQHPPCHPESVSLRLFPRCTDSVMRETSRL